MAAFCKIPRFVEVSTAFVYKSSSSTAATEQSIPSPKGKQALAKRAAELELQRIDGIDIVIVRPAIVYGSYGDLGGIIFGRIVCASTYCTPSLTPAMSQQKPNTMVLLWDHTLKLNTVHVSDVCKGLWHAYLHAPPRSVWNLADRSDTDQGKLSSILESLFKIKVEYYGSFLSNVAR